MFFFFKQKTAYEMRISDWSSDVCSSDLASMVMTVERTHSTSGNLALAAGAGVAAGFAANLIRKAVMQAPTALSGNWSDALAAEHQMTLASFDKLEKTTPKQNTKRPMLLSNIHHSLAKHPFQQEKN